MIAFDRQCLDHSGIRWYEKVVTWMCIYIVYMWYVCMTYLIWRKHRFIEASQNELVQWLGAVSQQATTDPVTKRTMVPYSLPRDDVTKWKHFPCYWTFVWGIHWSPVNSPHKGQWHGALMFSLICVLNKQLSKQSWGWWFETPSPSLWRHCNVNQNKLMYKIS